MKNNKFLYLLMVPFLLMLWFKYTCARIYRSEINVAQTKDEMQQMQKHAESYFTMTDAAGEEALKVILKTEEHGHDHAHSHDHDHDHDHAHVHEHVDCCDEEDGHVHDPGKPCVCKASVNAATLVLNEGDQENGHHHHHHHDHEESEAKDPSVSPGLAILLKQLGFAELAANLLWVQMDADSHREMWHRVDFALDMIPLLDPTFIEAYLLKSYFMDTYRKQHKEALEILEGAVKHVGNRIELWQQIGILTLNHRGVHGDTRDLDRALEAFTIMSNFADSPFYTERLKAITLAAMGRREEAVKVIEESLKAEDKEEQQRELDLNMIERIRSGEEF